MLLNLCGSLIAIFVDCEDINSVETGLFVSIIIFKWSILGIQLGSLLLLLKINKSNKLPISPKQQLSSPRDVHFLSQCDPSDKHMKRVRKFLNANTFICC